MVYLNFETDDDSSFRNRVKEVANYYNIIYRRDYTTITNINQATETGIYWINTAGGGTILNSPYTTMYLIVIKTISTHCTQLALEYTGSGIGIRGTSDLVSWSSWKKL